MGSSVLDAVRMYAELKGSGPDEALDLISKFGLEETLRRKIFQLSSGQQKMIGNILALSFSPSIVLLDEPFENVDQGRRIKLLNIIETIDAEIILNTHELDILKRFKKWGLYFIVEGKLLGRFDASNADRLFLNRGDIHGNLAVLETSFGKYSITKDSGQVPLSSARDLASVFEEVQ
jgi:ABC-type multidrug transport system ATPase subunit